MFWQVMDHPGVEGNYLETSGTALFAYAVLKGVRLGYLPKRMAAWAEKAFYGTCDKYLSKNPDGSLQLDGICLVVEVFIVVEIFIFYLIQYLVCIFYNSYHWWTWFGKIFQCFHLY